MKTFKQILLFAILVTFAACKGGDNAQLVAKKWKIDGEELKKSVKNEIEKMKKENPEQAKMAEGMSEMMVGMLGSMTMDFKADGTYEQAAMGQTQKGKWTVSNDGKALMTEDDKGKKDTIKIKELNEKKMILDVTKPGDKNSPMSELVFIPA